MSDSRRGHLINGVNYPYNFSSNNIVTVTFDGGIGNDTANLTGSTRTDTATLSLASFSGSASSRSYYRVDVSSTPKISFRGAGGADTSPHDAARDRVRAPGRNAPVGAGGHEGGA